MIEVLNLGGGVQSTTVALMSVAGELPPVEWAIFADTGWEPQAVYKHMDWLQPVLEQAGIKVRRLSFGNIRDDALCSEVRGVVSDGRRWASMPYFTKDRETGAHGMIRRQCTGEYKIKPIERFIKQAVLGLPLRARYPKEPVVRRWYGISFDEMQRARFSEHKWATNYYPLIDARMTRRSCLMWMERNGYPEPPRSACIGCPFKHDKEWKHLRDTSPAEFQDAIDFDNAIRTTGGERGDMFIHASRLPLSEVKLDDTSGQMSLWDDECTGMCGM